MPRFPRPLRSTAFTLGAFAVLGACVLTPALDAKLPPEGNAVLYEIRFPNAVHREAEITVHFRAVPPGELRIRMARSSPGRYAAHDFAKNVYGVKVTDAAGTALRFTRVSPQEWLVERHTGEVRFSYTLFADRADGTYSGIDGTRAHLSMPATFAWSPSLSARPIEITFVPPDTAWRIATQLQPTSDPRAFRAPNLQYFLDSPTHLGMLDIREWTVAGGTGSQTVRLALNHLGTTDEATRFTDLTKQVVAEMSAVFGELPQFDYGTYTFIACYRPNCSGDGMEHRNSTSLTSSASLSTAMMGLLGAVSHEFFHAWNVERIRPASIEPFDFTDANMSGELWLAEGFTNYYGPLVIARAGIVPRTQYARQLSGAVNTLTTSPARRFNGAVGMSQQAPFVDAATSIDPTNRPNTFISYYTYGEALGLALDLALRARAPATDLDAYMQLLWRRFGHDQTSAFAPVRTYRLGDLESALADVTGDAGFARDFFARYVVGSELPDYPTLLGRAGFLVRQAQPAAAWMGDTRLSAFDGEVIVAGPTTFGSPMYEAGLSAGDRILSIDDLPMGTSEQVRAALAAKKPGDQVRVTWRTRAGQREAMLTLRADPRVEVVAFEETGRTPSAAQLAFRESWLRSQQH